MGDFMIVALPKPDELEPETQLFDHLAAIYREFRLLALQTNPEAFGAVHAFESLYAAESWQRRLADPKARYFIAIKYDQRCEIGSVLAKARVLSTVKWYGSLILLGPQEQEHDEEFAVDIDPFSVMTKADPLAELIAERDDALPLHYHVNGMFVRPEARGSGIARKLMDALLNSARADAHQAGRNFECTIFVDELNVAASQLYLQSGFTVRDQKVYSKRTLVDGEWSEEDRILLEMSLTDSPGSRR